MGCGGSKSDQQATSPKPKPAPKAAAAKPAEAASAPAAADSAAPAAAPGGNFLKGKTVKLVYFDFPGRGDLCRRMFCLKNVQFEDVRIKEETEWPEYQKDTPWGTVPVLEVDGVKIGQSKAIAKLVAKDLDLNGKGPEEAAHLDELNDFLDDFLPIMASIFYAKNEEEKAALVGPVTEKAAPEVARLEAMAAKSSSGYLVGDQLSYVDLHFYVMQFFFGMFLGSDFMKSYPSLVALTEKIAAIPEMKAYDEKYIHSFEMPEAK